MMQPPKLNKMSKKLSIQKKNKSISQGAPYRIQNKNNKKKHNKKAQIGEILFIVATLFSLAVALLASKLVLSKFKAGLDESGYQTAESNASLNKIAAVYPTFDYMIVFVLVGLTIGLMISSYFIPAHPAFVVVNIIGVFLLVFMGALMSNMYGEMISSENEAFYDAVSDGSYSKLGFIMNRLPWICVILTILSSIVMYSKSQTGGL